MSCYDGNDGSASASASGGTPPYSYSWSNGGGGFPAGTYTATVTDGHGCSASSSSIAITQPDELLLLASVTHVSVAGGSNGSIDLTVTGGTQNYTYSWSNGITTQDVSGLTADTFTVTVTDVNGCTATESATVTEPVSIFDLSDSKGIKIFPNPNHGNFEVVVEGAEVFTGIKLLNTLGQVVYSVDLNAANFSNRKIGLQEGLNKGLYILQLIGNKSIANKIVVVN